MKPKGDRPLKILVVHTANGNLGDTVLMDNDVYLLKKALRKRHISHELFIYSLSSRDITQVKYMDAVFFAGGILKDTTEKFWLWIPELIREADEYGVPVFLSAIGAEPRTEDDPKGEELRETVNLPAVKGISIRDDRETLLRDYITRDTIRITPVLDPAVWCRDCYRELLPDRKTIRKNTRIGLGIARSDLFSDYGHPEVTEEMQLCFWAGVVRLLEDAGLPWELFTNGDPRDERFAARVLSFIGHGEKAPVPLDASALVVNISRYRGVIACRMHSNIIAYSLSLPGIGFIWNRKLRFFGEKIGHPERFLEVPDMTPERAVNALKQALTEKTGPGFFKKRSVYRAIYDFVKDELSPRLREGHGWLPARRLLAPSLGNIEKRYDRTNTIDAFRYSLSHGYCSFEASLRLTADDRLVLTESWSPELYRKMGLENAEELGNTPLSYEEFKRQKLFCRFPTADFREFVEIYRREAGSSHILLLNPGKPSEAKLPVMIGEMKEALTGCGFTPERLLLRAETKKAAELFASSGIPASVVWHFTTAAEEPAEIRKKLDSAVSFCREKGILFISLRQELFTDENAAVLRSAGLRPIVLGSTKADRLLKHFSNGAYLVGSRIYDADYLGRLLPAPEK